MIFKSSDPGYPEYALERFRVSVRILSAINRQIVKRYVEGGSSYDDYDRYVRRLRMKMNLLDLQQMANRAVFSIYLELRDLGREDEAEHILDVKPTHKLRIVY